MTSLLPDINPVVNAIIDKIEVNRRLCGREDRKAFYAEERVIEQMEPCPPPGAFGHFTYMMSSIKDPGVRLLNWCKANDVEMYFMPQDMTYGFAFGPPPEFFRLTDAKLLSTPIAERIELARQHGIMCGAIGKCPNILYLDHGAWEDFGASREIMLDRMHEAEPRPRTYRGMVIRNGEQEGPGVAVEWRCDVEAAATLRRQTLRPPFPSCR